MRSGAKFEGARKNKSQGGGEVREASRTSLLSPPLLFIAELHVLREAPRVGGAP